MYTTVAITREGFINKFLMCTILESCFLTTDLLNVYLKTLVLIAGEIASSLFHILKVHLALHFMYILMNRF